MIKRGRVITLIIYDHLEHLSARRCSLDAHLIIYKKDNIYIYLCLDVHRCSNIHERGDSKAYLTGRKAETAAADRLGRSPSMLSGTASRQAESVCLCIRCSLRPILLKIKRLYEAAVSALPFFLPLSLLSENLTY